MLWDEIEVLWLDHKGLTEEELARAKPSLKAKL
jgi:hypothetical protein